MKGRELLLSLLRFHLPLTFNINVQFSLQILVEAEQLSFVYYERTEEGLLLDTKRSAPFFQTFCSPILSGWTTFEKDHFQLLSYLAFVTSTWAKALCTFISGLSEYEQMSLSPRTFLPPPSSTPFYLRSFQDFNKTVKGWTSLFKEYFNA